jgi:hypothetical protein
MRSQQPRSDVRIERRALHERGRLRLRLASAFVVVAAAAVGLPEVAWGLAAPKQFTPTGHQQVYKVPSGVALEGVVAVGGWGGSTDPQPPASNNIFAEGATVQGYLVTTPGETLYPEVGQSGTAGGGPTFGGGGAAGASPPGVPDCKLAGSDMSVPCSGPWAGSGGGASDVRTCSELVARCPGGGTSAESRLIVASGGGGEGGQGLNGNGAGCDNGGDAGGKGQNEQLPSASPAGPAAIKIATGIVIPGFGGGGLPSVMTIDGSTNAAMGTTAAGAGGASTGCSVNKVSYSGSVAGRSGSGPDGGAGGNASGLGPCCGGQTSFAPGGGGGGGGGYFGGGGGATGMGTCGPSPCGNGGTGAGGAAGSSFVAKAIEDPEIVQAYNTGDVFIEFVPVIEIDRPTNGAVYSPGQVVDASWSCGYSPSTALGASNCTGTDTSGSPINTTPGVHTFTVHGIDGSGRQLVGATVTYTVKASGGGGKKSVHTSFAGLTFTLTGPASAVGQGQALSLRLGETGSSKAYKATSFSYYIDRGVKHTKHVTVGGKHKTITVYTPNLVTHAPGSVNLSTKGLSAGLHTVKVLNLLHATRHAKNPATKTLTLKLSIMVA